MSTASLVRLCVGCAGAMVVGTTDEHYSPEANGIESHPIVNTNYVYAHTVCNAQCKRMAMASLLAPSDWSGAQQSTTFRGAEEETFGDR